MVAESKKNTPKEILIILEWLHVLIQGGTVEICPREISDLDWKYLLLLAREQRVLGLLGHALEKSNALSPLEETVKEEIKKNIHEYNQAMLIKKWQFSAIHRLCQEKNIVLIPYKGAALALTVFKDMPFRRMSDVDFFIRENDVPSVYPILLKQGFERVETPYPNRWQAEILRDVYYAPAGRESLFKTGWDLDIHRQARYHIEDTIVSLNVEEMWSRAKPRATECGEVLFLDDIDHALLLLFHAIELFAPHFIQIVDVALVMKSSGLRKKDLMTRLPPDLGPKAYEFINSSLDAVEELLSPHKYGQAFAEDAVVFFELFFYKRKRTYTEPLSSSGWKRLAKSLKAIRGLRKKIIFLAGFFVPNPDYYRPLGKKGFGMILEQWRQLGLRILSATFKSPG